MELTQDGKRDTLFDGRVNVLHTGTAFGVVHPKEPNFSNQFARLLALTGQGRILAQKLAFNTLVTPIRSMDDLEAQSVDGFYRTPEASDGVIVSITDETRLKIAVMIMNADCGVIKILAPNGELAVLHGGLDNVDNKDGSSIVRNAVDYFKDELGNEIPGELQLSVGEAALNCCYGLDAPQYAVQNEARRKRLNEPRVPVKNLPRKGGVSFNVPEIIRRQAIDAGLSTTNISVEQLCTSCHGLTEGARAQMDTHGTWFSNLRESKKTLLNNGYGSRNAVVVWA